MSNSDSFEQAIQQQRQEDEANRADPEEPSASDSVDTCSCGIGASHIMYSDGKSSRIELIFMALLVGATSLGLLVMAFAILWLPAVLFGAHWTSFEGANMAGALCSIVGVVLVVKIVRWLSS